MHGHARVWSRLVRAGHETSKFWLIEAVKRTGDSVQTRLGGSPLTHVRCRSWSHEQAR